MKILGVSAYYHDSSAALIVDDTVVAAAQEERFSRIKHDNSFPINACRFCLENACLNLSEIDAVVFFEKPFLKFERLLVSYITTFPRSYKMFTKTIPIWLKDKLNMRRNIRNVLKAEFGYAPSNIKFVEHHLAHAAFAYCTSGFDSADIIVVDAVGEWATTSIFRANQNNIEVVSEERFPDSVGLLYSSFTQFIGFNVNSDEYKVMGLAPYGERNAEETIKFIELITSRIVGIKDDGSIHLNLEYFKFHYSDKMIHTRKWEKLFGIKSRIMGGEITQSHKNLALAIQFVTENILYRLAASSNKSSSNGNLCLTGGVALNCAANGFLLNNSLYKNIYIPFAPGDCGCSIGAAMVYSMLTTGKRYFSLSPYLGPEYSNIEINAALQNSGVHYEKIDDFDEVCSVAARLIDEGHIIGWFQGRMEVGPRALGNRSIIADARKASIKDEVNSRIKFRESFRPFAPSVLAEYADILFKTAVESPYMMFTVPVKTDELPAITHVDATARIQTVTKSDNPLYHNLLSKFHKRTGCPAILNTSFNVMGEPIVCSPTDALTTFKKSGLDYLIIGNYIVKK
ncbi:MAG: carbamoyltransferase [Muribaculaceae bacterium]|nr:carbamoyltransferase [Muribaculaceae bacterium]